MKKILVHPVREEAKYFCDKHPDREAFTEVVSMCWYGSKFDLQHIRMNLCDECMDRLYTFVKENFGVEPFDDGIQCLRCQTTGCSSSGLNYDCDEKPDAKN